MKKTMILIFSIGLLAFIPNLNAATNSEDIDTGLYKENIFIEEYERNGYPNLFENNNGSLIQPRYFTTELDIAAIQQINNIYCGYAAVQEILTYFHGWGYTTQQSLAAEVGTTGQALSISNMVLLLNNHSNAQYYATNAGSWSLNTFVSNVHTAIANQKPMVIMAYTWPLTMYTGSANKTHYIVVTGYTMSYDDNWNDRIIYIDSYNADYGNGYGSTFGKHVETKENMWRTFYGDTVQDIVLGA